MPEDMDVTRNGQKRAQRTIRRTRESWRRIDEAARLHNQSFTSFIQTVLDQLEQGRFEVLVVPVGGDRDTDTADRLSA